MHPFCNTLTASSKQLVTLLKPERERQRKIRKLLRRVRAGAEPGMDGFFSENEEDIITVGLNRLIQGL